MTQDINKIISVIGEDWANIVMIDKRKIAVLMEENNRLKSEIEALKTKDGSAE